VRLRLFQRRPTFTAHNIELPDGSQTLPGEPLIGDEPTSNSYLRTLQQFCPPPAKVADLGCLEGGYAVDALGANAVALLSGLRGA